MIEQKEMKAMQTLSAEFIDMPEGFCGPFTNPAKDFHRETIVTPAMVFPDHEERKECHPVAAELAKALQEADLSTLTRKEAIELLKATEDAMAKLFIRVHGHAR